MLHAEEHKELNLSAVTLHNSWHKTVNTWCAGTGCLLKLPLNKVPTQCPPKTLQIQALGCLNMHLQDAKDASSIHLARNIPVLPCVTAGDTSREERGALLYEPTLPHVQNCPTDTREAPGRHLIYYCSALVKGWLNINELM